MITFLSGLRYSNNETKVAFDIYSMRARPFSNTPSYSLLFYFEDEDDEAMPTLNKNHILKLIELSVPAALQTWECKMVTLSLGICIYKRTVLRVGKTNIFYFLQGLYNYTRLLMVVYYTFAKTSCQILYTGPSNCGNTIGQCFSQCLLAITCTFYLKWQLRLG